MPARVRITSEEPFDVEIAWGSRPRGRSVRVCSDGLVSMEIALGSKRARSTSRSGSRPPGRDDRPLGRSRRPPIHDAACESEPSENGSEASPSPFLGSRVLGEADALGWHDLSTHWGGGQLAAMGPVWACQVVVTSCLNFTMDLFDEEWQTSITVFRGPEVYTER